MTEPLPVGTRIFPDPLLGAPMRVISVLGLLFATAVPPLHAQGAIEARVTGCLLTQPRVRNLRFRRT